jgi:hypothetical protein
MGGYHLIFSLYQQGLKTEMKAFLKENKQSKFGTRLEFALDGDQIKDASFSWEDENEEFRYHQDLYDVLNIEKQDGKIILICIKDNDENQLESQLKEIHKINNTGNSKSLQNNFKFFSSFYFNEINTNVIAFVEKNKLKCQFSSNLFFHFFDVPLHPPQS